MIGLNLDAEGAADVRRNHADLAFGKAQDLGDAPSERMRIRRGRPHRQAVLFFIIVCQIGARFDRTSRDPVAADFFFDHDFGVLENFVDTVRGEMIFVNDVAAGIFMDQRRAGLHRRFRIDDHRQRLVVHRHRLGGVFRQVTIVRHHHGQRLAEITDFIHRQRIKLHRPEHRAAADPQRLHVLRDVRCR